ncbi:hypothetical protein [Pseudonocardia abyssalis]|uniref:Uncharacterized protein n=1 Tax=Pseudonocardia abyssalis TaxID=2792008 RepID=A0ABS6UZH5_9PSEU|nr:hypothetical protein [Pseudonocardia abyssalis]MBW0116055.1 hypothetical protein [Pseudonocardia abyssalis]MBW0137567.1 hypothetical protein [Pseudonocardia abyssalis]
MTRRNRVDPWGDLHAVPARGMFTGNRGCLVDDDGTVVRHHRGNLWISCVTRFRDRRVGLARPGRWTPLFFLDDAVALAAGHRPCGECRHGAYLAYREAVTAALGEPVRAGDLNRALAAERLRHGRGLVRAGDRRTWCGPDLPDGTVVLADGPRLVLGDRLFAFSFDGWCDPVPRLAGDLTVLTPPTSVAALRYGFRPVLASHDAGGGDY